MAITPSVLYESGCVSSGSTTTVSASISPAGSSKLVVMAGHMSTGGHTITGVSDSFTGSGTWNLRVEPTVIGSRLTSEVWDCDLGASPGSGTVTATWSNSSADHRGLVVVELDASGNVINFIAANSGGASSASNPETIAVAGYTTGNLLLSFFFGRDQLNSTATGGTIIGSGYGQSGTHFGGETQHRSDSGTATWVPNSTAGNRWFHKIALEYEESGGGASRRVFHIS